MRYWQEVTCPKCEALSERDEADLVPQNHVMRCACGHVFTAVEGVRMLRTAPDGSTTEIVPVSQWPTPRRKRAGWEGIYE